MQALGRFNEKYSRYLLRWCYVFLLVFMAGFFFLGTSKQLNNLFYIALGLPALVLLAGHTRHLFNKSRFFLLFSLLAGWLVLTSLLMADPPSEALADLKPLLYIFLLAAIIFLVSEKHPDFPITMCWAVLIIATVTGLWRIYDFYSPDWVLSRRLVGSGALPNSLWVGAAYGFAALISVILYLRQEKLAHQFLAILLGVTPLAAMLLAQSRGPYVAFAVAVIYSLIVFRNRRALILAAAASLVVMFSLVNLSHLMGESRLIKVGDSHRLAIWGNAIEAIGQSPVFGHGVAQDTENSAAGKTFDHFHNVYLTLVFHSGIVGFLLFMPLLLRPFLTGNSPQQLLLRPMLIFGMTYMVFNASRLFTSPKELWLIFWIPLLLLWASDKQAARKEPP